MEQFKFRAWDIHNKRMIYFSLQDLIFSKTPIDLHEEMEVNQSIGLVDNKGDDIYVMDILRFKCRQCEFIHVGLVDYDIDLACFVLKYLDKGSNDTDYITGTPFFTIDDDFKLHFVDIQDIVGNAYEYGGTICK